MSIKKICNCIRRYYTDLLAVWLVLCMAAGWWGILYPQLTLNADTCRVVTEDGEQILSADGTAVYKDMLNADRTQLRFRSRLMEEILSYLDNVHSK